jgi:hypothetical protein
MPRARIPLFCHVNTANIPVFLCYSYGWFIFDFDVRCAPSIMARGGADLALLRLRATR